MAMRVVTLERLGDFIENKLGSKQTIIKSTNSVKYVDSSNKSVSCEIPSSQMNNLSDEHPFLKFRDQISGVLTVSGSLVKEDDIRPYSYLLD